MQNRVCFGATRRCGIWRRKCDAYKPSTYRTATCTVFATDPSTSIHRSGYSLRCSSRSFSSDLLSESEDKAAQQRFRRRPLAAQTASSYEDAISALPDGSQIHFDFFGEPVTFLGGVGRKNISNAIAALDGFEIGVVSKGKTFTGGGEEEGLAVQAAHSAALSWTELLRHASVWSRPECAAPMLAYIAVAPLLAQTGMGYMLYLDSLLQQVNSGVDDVSLIQFQSLADFAVSMKDNKHLNSRERAHLKALDFMMKHDHRRAMMTLLYHVESCPGDALAISIAMDLAHTLGDKRAAMRLSGSVASYWNERRGGLIRPSIPGHTTITGLISLGLAVGGRDIEAEQLATYSMDSGKKVSGGIASWAMACLYDAQGRTAEGISACANSDGTRYFEECGFLFFNSILFGYGVRFALDREERGRGRSKALRLYDNNYDRILDYSGFAQGQLHDKPYRKAPLGWKTSSFQAGRTNPRNIVQSLFAKPDPGTDVNDSTGNVVVTQSSVPAGMRNDPWIPACEDILTWLPPTPKLLADATLLLLRLTLNGTISSQNYRWEELRNGWRVALAIQSKYGTDDKMFQFSPVVCIAASLLTDPSYAGNPTSGPSAHLAAGLNKMGQLLKLGGILPDPRSGDGESEDNQADDEASSLSTMLFREIVADKEPDFWLPAVEESDLAEWQEVLRCFLAGIYGIDGPPMGSGVDLDYADFSDGFEAWDFDVRPVLDHAVVYVCCKIGDQQSLSLARSICSRGVTLRKNSPEEWWRYSIVLGLLGDEVASEDALQASIAFGGGQGVRGD